MARDKSRFHSSGSETHFSDIVNKYTNPLNQNTTKDTLYMRAGPEDIYIIEILQ